MIKTIFFDCDGFVVKRETYFGARLSRDYRIEPEKVQLFFSNEFRLCETGKADLKQELLKYLPVWGWQGTVEDFLAYWFSDESQLDAAVLAYIQTLKQQGVRCCLATNNEKYRTKFLRENLGLAKVFSEIFSSSDIGFMKPQAEFWQKAYCPDMGAKNEILIIDDRRQFLEIPQAMGFNTHLFTTLDNLKGALEKLG